MPIGTIPILKNFWEAGKAKMKVYEGKRVKSKYLVTVNDGSKTTPLVPFFQGRPKLGHEFNWGWGFNCFGAIRLAQAMLADFFGCNRKDFLEDERKVDLSYYFGMNVFKKLQKGQDWALTGKDIEKALSKIVKRTGLSYN